MVLARRVVQMDPRMPLLWALVIVCLISLYDIYNGIQLFSADNTASGTEGRGAGRGCYHKRSAESSEGHADKSGNQLLTFAVVLCEGREETKNQDGSLGRQLRQVKVLLKSVIVLTTSRIRFEIVTDSEEMYSSVVNSTLSWPQEYQQRLQFGARRDVYYPRGSNELRHWWRECSTGRLFLHEIFNTTDALIFLDTDIIFMQPPEYLWAEFGNFDVKQVVGEAPSVYVYSPAFKLFPTFGSTGVNNGVILMNLTRLREFPGGWSKSVLVVAYKYKNRLTLADQDIVNIIFSREHSGRMYELGCEWNVRPRVCSRSMNKCSGAASRGVAVLHGCSMTFMTDEELRFRAVFEAWEQYDLRRPVRHLLRQLEAALRATPKDGCGILSNIDEILLKGFRKYVENIEPGTALPSG
ncbi:glucoside xylosyltransferase 1-like [Panulirus ornatus]|uniref:glucoside xylosyltransferase 1-like n=1 Tax=Panulirus ornatus TaxID=150431 RepID=UPI003A85B32F